MDLRGEQKFPDPTAAEKVIQFSAILDRDRKVSVVSYDYPGCAIDINEHGDMKDRVEVDGEWLRILGRDGDAINVGGLKVDPTAVEAVLLESCPDAVVNGDRENRLPNTTSISFEYVEGEAILLRLNEFGICASSGSACTSGSLQPSHVLRAMGIPYTAIHGSVRFSLSSYTTRGEIDRVIEVLPPIIRELRSYSPFGRDKFEQYLCRIDGARAD